MSRDLNKSELEKKLLSLLKPDVLKAKSAADLFSEIGVDALRRFSRSDTEVDELVLKKQAERRILRTLESMVEKQEIEISEDAKILVTGGKPRCYYLEKQIDYSKLLKILYGLDKSLVSSLVMRLPSDEQQDIQQLEDRKLPAAFADWQQKIFIGRSGVCYRAKIDQKTISVIYDAVETERFVAFDYENSKGLKKRIEVFPWGIMLRGESCYLVANTFENVKPFPVTYAMHRIEQPEITERIALTHPSMPRDQHAFLQFCQERQIDLFPNEEDKDIFIQLHFYGDQGRSLYNTVLSADQIIEELPEGQLRLTATVRNGMELHRFIMGYGDDIEVEAPAELRDLIAQKMKNSAARYQSESSI